MFANLHGTRTGLRRRGRGGSGRRRGSSSSSGSGSSSDSGSSNGIGNKMQLQTAIATDTATEYVRITIADTGCGVQDEHRRHIFDRFYSKGDHYIKNTDGIGIGLALTKELVELHRGEIYDTSEVGKGATFANHLPLAKDHLMEEEMVESDGTGFIMERLEWTSGRDPMNPPIHDVFDPSIQHLALSDQIILIVDDNPDMRGLQA